MEEEEAKTSPCCDMINVHVPRLKEHFISIMIKAHFLQKSLIYQEIKEDACFFRKTMRAGEALEKAVRINSEHCWKQTAEKKIARKNKTERRRRGTCVERKKLNDFAKP